MVVLDQSRRLKQELSLFGVFAISLGATLSSGFFLLPGLAAKDAGPAVIVTYLIALLPLVPGIMSKVELSTAMPRAGGVYYFIDRALGPLFGTISGLGTWLVLILKVAFALLGMGAYLGLAAQHNDPTTMKLLAIAFAIGFGLLNLLGAGMSGRFQMLLVGGLLILLAWFISSGSRQIQLDRFEGFFDKGPNNILSTAGLVCVSYIGLTKVASVSEEVKRPERNLPLGMFLAVLVASVIYVLGTTVMVGVLPFETLANSTTPVADTASVLAGNSGRIVMIVAASLAFFAVANAGILSASRYPLAMSRDRLVPSVFQSVGSTGTPRLAIAVTVVVIVVLIASLDVMQVAKLAAAFQLMLFAMNCIAVVIMRESKIDSYDPGYRAPWYPWLHITGIVAPCVLIIELGWMPIVFGAVIAVIGGLWFYLYARHRVRRHGAIYHVFERLGRLRFDDLDAELRGILKEKGLRERDPFEEVVTRAHVLTVQQPASFEHIVQEVSRLIAPDVGVTEELMAAQFLDGTRTGATPVTGGIALPHFRVDGLDKPHMAIVRVTPGVVLRPTTDSGEGDAGESTTAILFLVSPADDPKLHLRVLAELATRVEQEGFMESWMSAPDDTRLREILLRSDRYVVVRIDRGRSSGRLIGKCLKELDLPESCLVAVIRRQDETIIPRGATRLFEGDQLTIIGDPRAIIHIDHQFST